MGQREVIEIIERLGGQATRKQIAAEYQRCVSSSRRQSLRRFLDALKEWGYVTFDPRTETFALAEPYPEPNRADMTRHDMA